MASNAPQTLRGTSPEGFHVVEVWDSGCRVVVWSGTSENQAHKMRDALERRDGHPRLRHEVEPVSDPVNGI